MDDGYETETGGTIGYEWFHTSGFYLRLVEDPDLAPGDVCVRSALENVADCPEEGAGRIDIDALQALSIVFDGDVSCDGCAEVTVDGAPAGTVCFEPR